MSLIVLNITYRARFRAMLFDWEEPYWLLTSSFAVDVTFDCPFCDLFYTTKEGRREHVKSKHPGEFNFFT